MERFAVQVNSDMDPGAGEAHELIVFDTPDVNTALLVTDINIGSGTAEIWHEGHRLARLRKRRGDRRGLWEVS